MKGGIVVKEYSPEYTHCSFCGTKMVWKARENGYSSYTGKPLPVTKTFGCPKYGGYDWHDFWWEDNLFDIIMEDMKNAEDAIIAGRIS